MMKFKFIRTKDPEYTKELMLRWEILRKPLGLPPGTELCENEDTSLHLVAVEGKKLIGCVLFCPEGLQSGWVSQLAISDEYVGKSFCRQLISTLEETLISRGFRYLHLFSRAETIPFFEGIGYKSEGETIIRLGIPHQLMRKRLPEKNE